MKKHDVLIIGGGPGGSTLAALLRKKGYDVGIIERERFPRFHIGESLLPATMPIFKETGFYPKLDSGKHIRKYGARFVDYRTDAEVRFGFQNGFNADIPMAFEVERSEFDEQILEHAKSLGAHVYPQERARTFEFDETGATVTTDKDEYRCSFLVDATGRDAMLSKHFKTRSVNKDQDLNNVAVFAHYTGVKRFDGIDEGDITIGLLPEKAWTWIIPFKGEKTSVGVVCNSSVFKGGTDLAAYLDDRLCSSPRMTAMMKDAERCSEITVISNYSHKTETFTGDRWIAIGDAAVFLDPIFSSGVHVSCTSAKLASQAIEQAFDNKCGLRDNGIGARYQTDLMRGVERFHRLISMFYHDNFVEQMKKTLTLKNMREGFTSAVAGDMWNEENFILKMKVI